MLRAYYFAILSFLLHLLLYWGSQYAPIATHSPPQAQAIEIELRQSEESTAQQLIRQVTPPPETLTPLDDLKEKAKLLSERTQRVKKQMRAKEIGLARNSVTANAANRSLPETPPSSKSIEDYMRASGIPKPSVKGSRIGAQINDVAIGDFSALNTDRHLYYTYYARIEEAIRWIWEREIYQATQRPLRINGSSANSIWKTRIDIILNSEGQYESVELLRSSGIPDFDLAVKTAFQEARLFPHPPKEMITADGKIRLKYLFEVYYRPKFLARP